MAGAIPQMISPWISITTQPPAPADHTTLWTVLLIQAVTVGVFALGVLETRRRDRLARGVEAQRDREAIENNREKERETLRLNMKRDVFLEVAPAIQLMYVGLSRFVDLQIPVPALAEEMRVTLESGVGAVAKLQAVAGDETLEAARQVQTILGTVYVRLLIARMGLGERNDIEAIREIALIWRHEISAFPPLMAALISHAREELHMRFDRERFQNGIVDSNNRLFVELENMLGPLR